VTYSFSLHRLGRNTEALGIIQRLPPDELHEPHAAVYAALVVIQAGQLDLTREYVAAAESGTLYSEEKEVLEEAKAKLVAAAATPSHTNQEPFYH
jgi:hypothetical protein